MAQRYERSCGAIVFTRQADRTLYLILRETEGIWGFPKGHMEPGETEAETALREIKEETGLTLTLLPGFRETETYPLLREGRPDTLKQVTYFLAQYADQQPRRQESEVAEIRLLPYADALQTLQYEASRQLLSQARRHLLGQNCADRQKRD